MHSSNPLRANARGATFNTYIHLLGPYYMFLFVTYEQCIVQVHCLYANFHFHGATFDAPSRCQENSMIQNIRFFWVFLRRFSSRSILFFRGLFDFVESKKSNLLTSGKAYENNTPRRNVFVLSHLISFTSRFSRSLFNLGMSKLLLPTFSM